MKSLKKQRRIQIVIAAILSLGLAVGLMGYAFRDGINLYRAPTQVVEAPPDDGEVFRLGGLVEEGSL
ncbi:MAG: cytochrome c maturation protein CcmE, partial [Paracoccus sp. (in: a-proteobacteria)]|nr:cytochrome c maturation protein CcmE [Paracoccus sp. (in: a-proteobacteria)]